ncbi:hypothetical protein [Leptospira andrefontaineae]|uniref:Uncharacterized protein n=1 Tax=Leptospira andrefontaineae TaxID=2484976 RepID=A0A4R9H6Q1_9LEPT|nr:hypothetical protein [Leptospira andrefontaineae]TGK41280.1 hypothetical protein EHO65_07590 [Leptospira andrefontaineae]
MNLVVEVKEITIEEDKRIFQDINKMMLNSLILRRTSMSMEYAEFRKRFSNAELEDITIKIVKKEHPYLYQVCALIGTDFATWIHDDIFQLEKDLLFAEGIHKEFPVLKVESISELFARASKSHYLEFIID